jgi:hypothetical protein
MPQRHDAGGDVQPRRHAKELVLPTAIAERLKDLPSRPLGKSNPQFGVLWFLRLTPKRLQVLG